MTQKYLEQLALIMMRATAGGVKGVRLEHKHFFGGAAVYANGRICMSLTSAGFAVKLPEESRITLIAQEGANSLRYFPKGPIKKEYVVLPEAILNNSRALRRWVRVSVQYAASRPGTLRRRDKSRNAP